MQLAVGTPSDLHLNTMEDIDHEISRGLVELSMTILPLRKNRRKPFIKDRFLNSLCHQNRVAHASWITDGRPQAGRSYDSMKAARKRMRSYLT